MALKSDGEKDTVDSGIKLLIKMSFFYNLLIKIELLPGFFID